MRFDDGFKAYVGTAYGCASNYGIPVTLLHLTSMFRRRAVTKAELRMRSLVEVVVSPSAEQLSCLVTHMGRIYLPQEQWHDKSVHSMLPEKGSYYGLPRPSQAIHNLCSRKRCQLAKARIKTTRIVHVRLGRKEASRTSQRMVAAAGRSRLPGRNRYISGLR